jgi:hypothetical protein
LHIIVKCRAEFAHAAFRDYFVEAVCKFRERICAVRTGNSSIYVRFPSPIFSVKIYFNTLFRNTLLRDANSSPELSLSSSVIKKNVSHSAGNGITIQGYLAEFIALFPARDRDASARGRGNLQGVPPLVVRTSGETLNNRNANIGKAISIAIFNKSLYLAKGSWRTK